MTTDGGRASNAAGPERQEESVRKATADDASRLARTLAQAFYEDPLMRWILPNGSRRQRQLYRSFDSIFLKRLCLPHDETYTTEGIAGGALWLPPGNWPLGLLDNLRLLPHFAASWGRNVPRALRFSSQMDSKHPHDPHYFLYFLGVAPGRQGKGIGTSLMQPVLERCDRERIPAYLEASASRNRNLYARNGFEVVEEVQLPAGAPPIWRMWREPRA